MNNKIGIFDPLGENLNPLNGSLYSDRYKELAKIWSQYPAYLKARSILEALSRYQLLFVTSGTGSGKTTIIPKLGLHYTDYQGKVAVTLPKRVVTLSAASFAALTLDVTLGKEVGYMYKGSDRKMANEQNKIVYLTHGTLIMKIVNDPLLKEFQVVVVDEAHERSISIDILLFLLRQILESGQRPDLKIVIMSATIDPVKYQNYFKKVSSQIIHISGQPNYPIDVHFLERPTNSYLDEGLNLIDKLVNQGGKEDILFFITTSSEALQLCRAIRARYPRVYCIEVYADMEKDLRIYAESRDKFLELGNYDQKLIMATNVAESSITIDGLKIVIDSCYELSTHYNPLAMGYVYEKGVITKAQALQRRGRVGRTEPGSCYHLLTQDEFNLLSEYPEPDILRSDITNDLLKIIYLSKERTFKEGYQMINQLMDPPRPRFIDVAQGLYRLYQIVDNNDKLTDLGINVTKFSSLPLNRSLFLIYSYQLYCAREASFILAMLELTKGKIWNIFHKADTICESDCDKESSKSLVKKLVQKKSDHLTLLHIYQSYHNNRETAWARKYGIRVDLMENAQKLADNYYYRILNLSRAPDLDRVKSGDIKKRLLEALQRSHQHLIAKKLTTTYPPEKVSGQINKDSIVYMHYQRQSLIKKTFLYDELNKISGSWEFNSVTIIS